MMYFDQLLGVARQVHVVYLAQFLGAVPFIHFISNHDIIVKNLFCVSNIYTLKWTTHLKWKPLHHFHKSVTHLRGLQFIEYLLGFLIGLQITAGMHAKSML